MADEMQQLLFAKQLMDNLEYANEKGLRNLFNVIETGSDSVVNGTSYAPGAFAAWKELVRRRPDLFSDSVMDEMKQKAGSGTGYGKQAADYVLKSLDRSAVEQAKAWVGANRPSMAVAAETPAISATAASPVSSAAAPAVSSAPGLSEPQRLINAFVAPSKTFLDIRRNASWWVPWLLISILQFAFVYAFDQKVGWDTFMEQQIAKNPSAQARLDAMKPDQRERVLEAQSKVARYLGYATPVTVLISWVIVAAILMAIFNFGFGAEIPFKQSMATWGYATLPLLLVAGLGLVTIYASGTPESFNMNNPIASNPAYFLDPKNSKLLYWLASCLDAFGIWVIVLLGIGYSVVSNHKVKRNSAIAVFAVLYILFKGIGAIRA